MGKFVEGSWYEVFRDNAVWFQGGESCVNVQFGGALSDLTLTKRYYDFESKAIELYTYSGLFNEKDGSGEFGVWWLPAATYNVIATDYLQYAVVYGCDNWLFGILHTEQAWILSRNQEATETIKDKAKAKLAQAVASYD